MVHISRRSVKIAENLWCEVGPLMLVLGYQLNLKARNLTEKPCFNKGLQLAQSLLRHPASMCQELWAEKYFRSAQ